jgi:predicted RNA methylase
MHDEFELDHELQRAFSGIRAPRSLAASVMRSVSAPAPTRMPEVLDAIAWFGVLSMAACIAFFFLPR